MGKLLNIILIQKVFNKNRIPEIFVMKILFFILLIANYSCNGQKMAPQKVSMNLILIASTFDSSEVAFKRDSVLILHKHSEARQGVASYYKWYKIKTKEEFLYYSKHPDSLNLFHGEKDIQTLQFDSIKKVLDINNAPIFFTDISSPTINYDKGNILISDSLKNKVLNCSDVLFQRSQNYNFYICKGLDRFFFIFDDEGKLIFKFHINDIQAGVRDFFLYDIVGDSSPEIILILNDPMTDIENPVEIRVYSIQGLIGSTVKF